MGSTGSRSVISLSAMPTGMPRGAVHVLHIEKGHVPFVLLCFMRGCPVRTVYVGGVPSRPL